MTQRSYAGEVDRVALKLGEAAAAVGVHVETMRKWLNAGEIPGRKVGGSWLVSKRELERFVAGETVDRHEGGSAS